MSSERPPPSGTAPGGGLQDKLSAFLPGIAPRKEVPPDMTGKTALITGGPMGIGYEIARAFLKVGARVILVNRKQEQGDLAIKQFKEEIGDEIDVTWIGCDLGNLRQTKEIFDKIASDEKRMDVLICSAGINVNTYREDADGIDGHFGVNWLGHFLVVNTLYPLMRKTSKESKEPPRIVFESSEMHKMAPDDVRFESLEELNNDKLSPAELYGRTKLAVHPGMVGTEMQEQWDSYGALGKYVLKPVMFFAGRSPEQGSYSGIYAATSPEIVEKNWNGFYFDDPASIGSESDQAKDEQLQKKLWYLSTQLIKQKLGPNALKAWESEA
ncbi:hypothetical protein OIO90_003351 [Microbotryomycetes sp. JL221]|nr:hypothetical protein OIO90_003351 [Microbotryomycetes sp. JL221]